MFVELKTKILVILILFLASLIAHSNEIHWADTLISFSSEYVWEQNSKAYKPLQALGKPSVLPGRNISSECAWMPSAENYGLEYLIVGLRNPITASQVIINENLNPGSIVTINLMDSNENVLADFNNAAGFKNRNRDYPLILRFQKTNAKVSYIKIILKTDIFRGYEQIDAVGISEEHLDYLIKPDIIVNSEINQQKEKLSMNVNSYSDELVPLITPDGKTLYFTRDNHPQNFSSKTNEYPQDIWLSRMDNFGAFKQAEKLERPINNELNNTICSITPDGQTALLLNVYLPDGSMTNGVSIARRTGDKWGFPEPVNIRDFYNKNKYGEYTLSVSGRVLLLAIERNDTYGSKDIYVSFLLPDNSWSEPKNIGHQVNTADSEVSPFLAADERSLYFASPGYLGYGSHDIFVTRRLDDTWTNWSEPKNLGPSINTPSFDAYYSIPASGEFAYFSSGSQNAGTDIYRIKLPESAKPNPVVLIKGYVLNSKTQEPVRSKIIYESLNSGKEIGEAVSDAQTGFYSIALPAGENFGFRANVDGFASINENLDLTDLKQYNEIERNLMLVPLEAGNIIRLNNIFFDHDQSVLRAETSLELDRLVNLMNLYPKMTIEISGHTDDIGNIAYNKELSRKRAKAVYDYLLDKKILKSRISFKGYGKDKPLKNNDSEENRQENRRVEFKILKI